MARDVRATAISEWILWFFVHYSICGSIKTDNFRFGLQFPLTSYTHTHTRARLEKKVSFVQKVLFVHCFHFIIWLMLQLMQVDHHPIQSNINKKFVPFRYKRALKIWLNSKLVHSWRTCSALFHVYAMDIIFVRFVVRQFEVNITPTAISESLQFCAPYTVNSSCWCRKLYPYIRCVRFLSFYDMTLTLNLCITCLFQFDCLSVQR